MAETKQRRPNWTEEERVILVDAVNKNSERLFGKFKGCGSQKGGRVKEQAWEEVAEALNAKSGHLKRTAEEAKKQYANLKQRAKEKSDAIRRPKTGGGPKPASPSAAESKILGDMADRPTLQGLLDGIDSEDLNITVDVLSEDPGLSLENIQPNLSVPLDVTVDEEGILKIPSSTLTIAPSTLKKPTSTVTHSRNKRKVSDEELLTLEAERDKFRQEILKLKEETEFFKCQIELSKLKKQKLEIEIELLKEKSATLNEM